MSTKIFVNLPVADLDRSKDFFTRLGFGFNAQFTDERAASMVIGEDIYVMLLTEPFFATFTSKQVADASASTEVIVALSADSREEADRLADAAIAAGATETRPAQDQGFMYGRAFGDLDGHLWEVMWMDPSGIEG